MPSGTPARGVHPPDDHEIVRQITRDDRERLKSHLPEALLASHVPAMAFPASVGRAGVLADHPCLGIEQVRDAHEPPAEVDYRTTFTFTVDDQGNIDLDPVPPVDAGDAFEIGSHTIWTKID